MDFAHFCQEETGDAEELLATKRKVPAKEGPITPCPLSQNSYAAKEGGVERAGGSGMAGQFVFLFFFF